MRLRQEDHKVKASLGYIVKYISENNKQMDYNGAKKKKKKIKDR